MNILLDGYNFAEDWIYDKLKTIITSKTRVTIIPFAFRDEWVQDNEKWYECYNSNDGTHYRHLVDPFLYYGVNEETIRFINYYEDTVESLRGVLEDTDLVYFVGGLPDNTMRRLNELDMTEVINQYDGIIMGWSAGASMQCEKYYIDPDKDYDAFSWQEGLGHIKDFAVQVHYEGSASQMNSIEKYIKRMGRDVYTLTKDSAIIVDDNGAIELIGNAKKYKND